MEGEDGVEEEGAWGGGGWVRGEWGGGWGGRGREMSLQFTPGRSVAMDTKEEEVEEWEDGDREEHILSPGNTPREK